MDLKRDVFLPVAERLKARKDSLLPLGRFLGSQIGIEAWFKVEVVAALGDEITALNNKGADLSLSTGEEIELKAATDLNLGYIRKGCTRDNVPCLFLGDGRDPTRIDELEAEDVKFIAYEVFSDGANDGVVGLIEPVSKT